MIAVHPPVPVLPPYWGSVAELVKAKRGRTVSVCLPARDEAETVAPIVASIVRHLMAPLGPPLVDELIVLDDGSTDATAALAERAGACVVSVADVLPESGPGRGKGNVLWKSVAASTGDVIVWCDTDLTSFTPEYVTRLVAPLLQREQVDLVKGFYERPLDESGQGGGRTTELVARPLLSMFFPPLATMRQPLGGECAARRSLLERIPFVEGYGIETGLLIDTLRLIGTRHMAQVDLGVRNHRHRTLVQLSEQASEITAVVLGRAGLALPTPLPPLLDARGEAHLVEVTERPPLVEVAAYRDRARVTA
jgi:glucosyl-3-phosphoglycerate synthase